VAARSLTDPEGAAVPIVTAARNPAHAMIVAAP